MNDLTFKKISKELFSLALPMSLTQLVTVGSSFISMVMLSKLGPEVLAASALIFSSRISIIILGSAILFALSVLIGHAFGEKAYERIGNFVQQGWLLGFLLSIPIMIIFWEMDIILIYFGQSAILTQLVKEFFHVNVWNVIPFLLSVCNQQLCYGTRKQKIDLIANGIGIFILLVSAYLLIFGKFGFPKMGVAGLGYALNLQGWFYLLFTTAVFYWDPFFQPFNIFKFRIHQSWQDLLQMFRIGWPISIQIGGEMLSFFGSAAMVGWLGVQPLAAYQIVTQYFFLTIVPLFAVAQATGVLVGHALGEKNYSKIIKLGYMGVIFSLIFTCLVAIIFIAIPKPLASIYLKIDLPANELIIQLVTMLFGLVALQQIFDGVRHVLTGALRGIFDAQFPMYVGVFVIWVIGIPLGYFLAFNLHLGLLGIVLGSMVGIILGMLLLIYRWEQFKNKFF